MGLMGHKKEAHQPTRGWCAPLWAGGRIGIGLGGAAPLSFSPTPPSLPLLLQLGKGGILLPVGVGLLQAHPLGPAAPPPPSFIYGGKGAPEDTQVDLRDRSLAMCGAPLHDITPRSYCSGA